MPGSSSWMPYAPQGVKGFDERQPVLRAYNITTLEILGASTSWNSMGLQKACTGVSLPASILLRIHDVRRRFWLIGYFFFF